MHGTVINVQNSNTGYRHSNSQHAILTGYENTSERNEKKKLPGSLDWV